ncbi:MAG: 4-hydroxythreonine-4-phosphate dehydrogenase PdxA [Proteobacteria bacterium]|uniref:4-hydroxythreonine-4-phosphate dehydrogenase n=1 Tax=Candidatus Avisuccinivibrio stercorigallinarum TaxID=2840704 RepID=A0A9D9DE66_9GAMM|nr:4-hydroxythreonine-4-phosphate dehydrogenase PdxA [Candidatus Avisuccinivibrio stercorigallinarum]
MAETKKAQRIVITAGEPAGIGPELMYHLAKHDFDNELIIIADPDLIAERLKIFPDGEQIKIKLCQPAQEHQEHEIAPSRKGELTVLPLKLAVPSVPGKLDPKNAPYVLHSLDRAHEGLISGEFAALVTAPVSKSVLDGCGVKFTGHTEYLQQKCGVKRVVMLLGCPQMKVALATTHLPLKDVPAAITEEVLTEVITILNHDLKTKFGIKTPRIYVAGLNPHAGEDGHLGREELEVIIPTLEKLRAEQGFNLAGPLPADTLFTPQYLADASAFLTMYHDQGLPVLKYAGFDQGYNTTLGLPYIRTSVDHGTALNIAGSGKADPSSLFAAIALAEEMAAHQAAAQAQ